jgi:hypothetical protein
VRRNPRTHRETEGTEPDRLPLVDQPAAYLTAKVNPDAYLPDFAALLNDLAVRLADVGRPQEALEPASRAVELSRALAEADPDAHLPSLAAALSTLANQLGEVGKRLNPMPFG